MVPGSKVRIALGTCDVFISNREIQLLQLSETAPNTRFVC